MQLHMVDRVLYNYGSWSHHFGNKPMTDLTYHGAEKAIKWAKKVVKGGYASGAENNEKRVNMKVLIRMAIIQLKQMKEEQNGQN